MHEREVEAMKRVILCLFLALISAVATAQSTKEDKQKLKRMEEQFEKEKNTLYPATEQPVKLWGLYPKIEKDKHGKNIEVPNRIVKGKLVKIYRLTKPNQISGKPSTANVSVVIEDEKGKQQEFDKEIFVKADQKLITKLLAYAKPKKKDKE